MEHKDREVEKAAEAAPGGLRLGADAPLSVPGRSAVHDTVAAELLLAIGAIGAGTGQDRTAAGNEPNRTKDGGERLPSFVVREDRPQPGGIFAATLAESAHAREFIVRGLIDLPNVDPGLDAFELIVYGQTLYIWANTPRGLLQGAYQLQDRLRASRELPSSWSERGTFRIPRRIFHPRFEGWPGERADFRHISRLGASHCLLSHDWHKQRNFQQFVVGQRFPDAVDADVVRRNAEQLRTAIDWCTSYALEPCLWMTELPCQGGPWVPEAERERFLTRYSAECLSDSGTYEGMTLCFAHPEVRAYYRDLIGSFFRTFPEIGTLFLFGMDSGGELCDPDRCPRCAGMSPIAQRDRLIRFLLEEGGRVRPGLRVLTTSWHWEHDPAAFLAHQRQLPAGSGLYMAAQKDGWQAERQSHELLREARAICRERGQLFIGYDNFHWGDDSVHGLRDIQDFPLGIAAKLQRWFALQADGVFDHWGGWGEDIASNAVACRAFMLNPLADAEAVCRDIAHRQFGDEAGPHVFAAWSALERAHRCLSVACTWAPVQWPGWYMAKMRVPVPGGFEPLISRHDNEPLPPKAAAGITYNGGEPQELFQAVHDAWREAYPGFAAAAACLEQAIERVADGELFYRHWWDGAAPSPSRKLHLQRQLLYVRAGGAFGRDIGLHFGLCALYLRAAAEADGEAARDAAFRRLAEPLLREDLEASEQLAALFAELGATGADLRPGRNIAGRFREKADGIRRYLRE
ncbi:hypothetical protein [Paenibacillus cymbidii]|uniref:hypothetical protein n=1 Tax=Paenibacillus cymbidii TaxID=1639034 RepID=UPI0010803295|nr:hypothetical protein [Paenibacillus cymbidii]